MEKELVQDFRCRLCLKTSDRGRDLFAPDSKYKFIVEDFTGLKIEYNTKLPSVICDACIAVINILVEFRITCKKSQNILENQEKSLDIEVIDDTKEVNDDVVSILDIKVENEDYMEYEQEISDDNMNEDGPKDESAEEKICRFDNSESGSEDKRSRKVKQSKTRSKRVRKTKNTETEKTKKSKVKKTKSENNETVEKKPKKGKSWKEYAKSYETSCYICGKMYDRFRIEYHINRHLDRRPFECKEDGCNKAFHSPTQLRQHNLYCHNEDSPHKCEICNRAFKTQSQLRMHKTYHFDPEIPCSLCGKLLRNRKALRRHMFNHTGERPYKCDECLKCFKNQWALKVHLRVHTQEEPFTCTICGMSFRYSSVLKHHMEKNHPESVVNCTKKATMAQTASV